MKTRTIADIAHVIIWTLVFIWILSGCKSPEQISNRKCAKAQAKYEKAAYRWGCPLGTESDSSNTSTESYKHDTTIYVPVPGEKVHDTIKVEITNGVVNTAQSRLDTEYAYATAQVINSVLVLNLYQKEKKIPVTIKDAIQKETKTKYYRITKTLPGKTTNYLTQWQIAQMWLGRILMGLLLLYILFIVIRGKYFII